MDLSGEEGQLKPSLNITAVAPTPGALSSPPVVALPKCGLGIEEPPREQESLRALAKATPFLNEGAYSETSLPDALAGAEPGVLEGF